MPRIARDKRAKVPVEKAARKMAEFLGLPPDSTEIFVGESGMVIIYLHKKPERTKEVLEQISEIFKGELILAGLRKIKVRIIDSDPGEWVKF